MVGEVWAEYLGRRVNLMRARHHPYEGWGTREIDYIMYRYCSMLEFEIRDVSLQA